MVLYQSQKDHVEGIHVMKERIVVKEPNQMNNIQRTIQLQKNKLVYNSMEFSK